MWTRAVWIEKDREEEGVVPSLWIKDMKLYWPPGVNAEKAIQEMREPGDTWRQFQVSKIKFQSESRDECEEYDLTTAQEESDQESQKRLKKRKVFEDFVTEPQQGVSEIREVTGEQTIHHGKKDSGKLPIPPKKVSKSRSEISPHRSKSKARYQTSKSRSSSRSSIPMIETSHPKNRSQRSRSKTRFHRSKSISQRSHSGSQRSKSSLMRSRSSFQESSSRSRSPKSRSRYQSLHSDNEKQSSRSSSQRMSSFSRSRSRSRSSNSRSKSRSQRTTSLFRRSYSTSRSRSRSHSKKSRSGSQRPKSRSHNSRTKDLALEWSQKSRSRSRIRSRSRSNESSSLLTTSNVTLLNRLLSITSRTDATTSSQGQSQKQKRDQSHQGHSISKSTHSGGGMITKASCSKGPDKDVYPMTEAKFQKRVLYLLTEIRQELKSLNNQATVSIADEEFHELVKATCIDELHEVEDSLKRAEVKSKFIQRLSNIGGISAKDCTRKVMERVMSNDLMAKYNMRGNKGKLPFAKTELCKVVRASVLKSFGSNTEHELDVMIGSVLKYAPDRRGGGGRKVQENTENAMQEL